MRRYMLQTRANSRGKRSRSEGLEKSRCSTTCKPRAHRPGTTPHRQQAHRVKTKQNKTQTFSIPTGSPRLGWIGGGGVLKINALVAGYACGAAATHTTQKSPPPRVRKTDLRGLDTTLLALALWCLLDALPLLPAAWAGVDPAARASDSSVARTEGRSVAGVQLRGWHGDLIDKNRPTPDGKRMETSV
eukprot:COSAG01_NODE_373_length_17991_cov_284.890075_29_plen_188_part_00